MFIILFTISASSLTSTTPKPLISGETSGGNLGRPNVLSPWLNPSNPLSNIDTKSIINSTPSLGNRYNNNNEDSLPPDILPFPLPPPLGNGSIYGISPDFEHTVVGVSVTSTTSTRATTSTTSSPPNFSKGRTEHKPERTPVENENYSSNNNNDREGDENSSGGVSNDNDYRAWDDEESEMTESSWDWANFERERPKENEGNGMDGMWSDKMAGNGLTQNPPIQPTQISHHGTGSRSSSSSSQDDLKLERGVSHPSSGKKVEELFMLYFCILVVLFLVSLE